jgi:hypothetical protein
MPKDEALRKAKLDFLASGDKTFQLPYYWASYVLIGKTDIMQQKAKYADLPLFFAPLGLMATLLLWTFG